MAPGTPEAMAAADTLADEWPRIAAEMKAASLPAPEYKTDGYFATTLYNAKPALPSIMEDSTKESKEKSKEKTIEKTLRLISENPHITTDELAKQCGLSHLAIYKRIRKLRENGTIARKGGDKGGEWIVTAGL